MIVRRRVLGPLVGLIVACSEPPAPPPAQPVKPAPPPIVQEPAPTPEPTPEPKPEPTPEPPPAIVPAAQGAVARGINRFTVALHRERAETPGNLFASGMSISLAFAMTHAGARGATAKEIERVFGFAKIPEEELQGEFVALSSRWAASPRGMELAVANRLYGEKTVKFKPEFLAVTEETFGAPLVTVDFRAHAAEAIAGINGWVEGQTRNKITGLLSPASVGADTRLVLVNAVYFKADWHANFAAAQTQARPFHGTSGERTVQMMARTGTMRLTAKAGKKARALELPYRGGEYAMVIVLPNEGIKLAAIEKALTAEALQAWSEAGVDTPVALELPRFKIEAGLSLGEVLKGMGVKTAFNPKRADFGGIAPKISISSAVHKAFIAVDEKGAEAAAATAVLADTGEPVPPTPVPFVCDRPFLFLIRDVRTGVILFMGRLSDPPA